MRTLLCLLAAMSVFAAPGVAGGQVTLERADELARSGRTEEARAMLLHWWEDDRPEASRRDVQRALWLRGRLTVDPVQAALDFRRLVVEYPGGPYSGQALLRLAQSEAAAGDSLAAAGHVRRLMMEYPTTAARSEAEAWLAVAGPLPEVVEAPSPERPSEEEESDAAEEVADRSEVRGTHAVQLGAFSSEERARALYQEAVAAGLEPRLVRIANSTLTRVRVGVFASSEEATLASEEIRGKGFTAAVVRDVEFEEAIR